VATGIGLGEPLRSSLMRGDQVNTFDEEWPSIL
jgi:hypothetical protein